MHTRTSHGSRSHGTLSAALAAGLLALARPALADPRVDAVVAQVQATNGTLAQDSYEDHLLALPVQQGSNRGYSEDGAPTPDLLAARETLRRSLSLWLGVSRVNEQRFRAGGFTGVNLVGVLPGEGPRRGEQYVLGAHLDSEDNAGADDDASGLAGVMEAARVLGQHRFDATIVFVAFDLEEEREPGWGLGSQTYARQAARARERVRAMIALDMIGYDHQRAGRATLSRCDEDAGTASARLLTSVVRAFGEHTDLRVTALTGEDSTDACRFEQRGFPSVTVADAQDDEGWPLNPLYHTRGDYYTDRAGRPHRHRGAAYLDPHYAARMVRGVVGWVTEQAGLIR